MHLSTSKLLHDLNQEGEFFQSQYIFMTGKNFPYFFLSHFKSVLQKKNNIKEWITVENITTKTAIEKQYLNTNLFNNQEYQTIQQLNELEGIFAHINNEKELHEVKKILDNLSLGIDKKRFYLFFITDQKIKSLLPYKSYDLEEIFTIETISVLIDYINEYYSIEHKNTIIYTIKNFFHLLKAHGQIEYLFQLFQFLPCIKKNDLHDYLITYTTESNFSVYSYSLFDLATLFFQKKITVFLPAWKENKLQYPLEFWIHFWQNQLWYAFLTIQNKNKTNILLFEKKVNRWFLKTGYTKYSKKIIKEGLCFLYKIHINHKIKNTNLEIDLQSFYCFWFSL